MQPDPQHFTALLAFNKACFPLCLKQALYRSFSKQMALGEAGLFRMSPPVCHAPYTAHSILLFLWPPTEQQEDLSFIPLAVTELQVNTRQWPPQSLALGQCRFPAS